MKKLILALALAALAMPAYAQGTKSPSGASKSSSTMTKMKKAPSTADFVKKAAIAGMFEVESSKVAQQKTDNPKVEDFAKMMIDDHTKANNELKSKVGDMQGMQVPSQLDAAHQKKISQLKSANGAKFMRQYKAEQVKGHKEAVSLFQSYAQNGDNAELKAWAKDTVPILQHHLQVAQSLPTSAAAPTTGKGPMSR